jgi:hypothetical protein
VFAGIGFGHQDLDVAPDKLVSAIREQPFGRWIDRADCAVAIDDDNRIDRGGDDRAIERVA